METGKSVLPFVAVPEEIQQRKQTEQIDNAKEQLTSAAFRPLQELLRPRPQPLKPRSLSSADNETPSPDLYIHNRRLHRAATSTRDPSLGTLFQHLSPILVSKAPRTQRIQARILTHKPAKQPSPAPTPF